MKVSQKASSKSEVFKNPVQDQQNIRWVIVLMLHVYLLIHAAILERHDDYYTSPTFLILSLFTILTVAIQVLIKSKIDSGITKAVAILTDIGMLSIFLIYGEEQTAFFYPLYLWVIIGNGTRYGIKHLIMAAAASIIGFGIVIASTPYWHQNVELSVGLLVGLALVPLYLSKLLTQLNSALEESVKANQAKSQFLANISHELRTPLTGIIASADLLTGEPLSDSGQKKVGMICDAAQSQMALINDLLDFSKAESGSSQEAQQVTSLDKIFQHVHSIMLPQAESKGIEYKVNIQPEMEQSAWLYPQAIQQVLINLVGNAIKFTTEGSVSIETKTLLDKEGNNIWRIEVTDTGIGISQSAIEKIFDPFVQADESVTRKFGGTGLGTAISKQLVEMMGGEINCESVPGKGSCFWLEIPVTMADSEDVCDDLEARSSHLVNRGVKRVKITPPLQVLVADDNRTNRDILEMILLKQGHQVTLVKDGLEALEALQNYQNYDLVMLDRNMPEIDGIQVMKFFKENTVGSAIRQPKFMLITADATNETRELALESGVDSFMTKPIRPDDVSAAIDELFIIVGAEKKSEPAMVVDSSLRLAVDNTAGKTPDDSTAGSDSVINHQKLEELEALSSGLTGQMIAGFIDDGDRLIQCFTKACDDGDFAEILAIAHAVKGSAMQLGATRLAEYCQSLKKIKRSEFDQKAAKANKEMKYLYAEARNRLLSYSEAETLSNSGIH